MFRRLRHTPDAPGPLVRSDGAPSRAAFIGAAIVVFGCAFLLFGL
jgi:hypothetical protein